MVNSNIRMLLLDCHMYLEAMWDCTCEDGVECERCSFLERIKAQVSRL